MDTLRETIPLQKAKVVKKSLGATLGLVLLAALAFALIATFQSEDAQGAPEVLLTIKNVTRVVLPIVFLLLVFWTPCYQYLYYRRYFYDMDDKNIVIRKGVVAQREITLPFSRITDVYVDQDLFDVLFGLYDVHMSTPTQESGLFAHIDGVNKAGSQQLRDMILERVNRG